jgi:predicted transcriptional regulator
MDLRGGVSMPDTEQFEDDEDAAADAEAEAELDAGLGIPHEEVAEWLKTWGTPKEKPAPDAWRRPHLR